MLPIQPSSTNETAIVGENLSTTQPPLLTDGLNLLSNFTSDTSGDSMSLISNDDDDDDEAGISSMRALTAKFTYIRAGIVPVQQEVPAKQENEFNSLDFDQNSETESCDQNHDTYVIAAKPKPKIVKPVDRDSCYESNCTDDNGKPETKSIRGKKKSAYVSPYSKESVNKPTTAMSPKKVVAISIQPSPTAPVRNKLTDDRKGVVPKTADNASTVTKTHILVNKSNLVSRTVKVYTSNPPATTPKMSKEVEKANTGGRSLLVKNKPPPASTVRSPIKPASPQKMPERQGTFIKEEPSSPDVPVVTSSEPSSPSRSTRLPTKLPDAKSSTSLSKSRTLLSKLKSPLQRPQTIAKALPPSSSTSSVVDPSKRRTPTNLAKRSNSQTAMKPNAKKDPFSTQPPSRSNSNLLTPPQKRDVTSRISSMWKRSDDTKSTATTPTTVSRNVVGRNVHRTAN